MESRYGRVDFDDDDDESLETADEPRRHAVISLLPSAATLGNLLCGFVAIYYCLREILAAYTGLAGRNPDSRWIEFFPTYVAIGAYLIVLGMIFDALDGQLARITRRTSEFGAQLDSIEDIVSFGVAPALLALTLLIPLTLKVEGTPEVSMMQWRFMLVASLVYVSCAAIRLARYNAENVKDEKAQKKFSGLPVPGAAAAFVALILLHEVLNTRLPDEPEQYIALKQFWAGMLRYAMAPTVVGLGVLMISRLDYMHLFYEYVRRKHPPTHLVWLVVAAGLWWFLREIFLVGLAYAYVLSGLVLNLRRRPTRPPAEQTKPTRVSSN